MAIQYILKLLNCLLSDEAIKDIESSTKVQAACSKWNHQKIGKSNFFPFWKAEDKLAVVIIFCCDLYNKSEYRDILMREMLFPYRPHGFRGFKASKWYRIYRSLSTRGTKYLDFAYFHLMDAIFCTILLTGKVRTFPKQLF
ncbi:hypothetical protein NPIL_131801 [Nephila pilipes]|uniref:Uncharacterized protein n=1 Tax=Nephila pilipes TaxID=299642 RepID=A0A8X6QBZ3_NEPPI|nr:hypothetical protein NPIL_131801 [Nephila pilipes]